MSKFKAIAEEFKISEATLRNWIKAELILKEEILNNSFEELYKKVQKRSSEKLSSRANKLSSKRTFTPIEYFTNEKNYSIFNNYLEFLNENFPQKSIDYKLFISAVTFSKVHNFSKNCKSFKDVLEKFKDNSIKNNLKDDLSKWSLDLNFVYESEIEKIFNFEIPYEEDFLGILYQSLKSEGEKSKKGSYYTPKKIVEQINSEYIKADFQVLDPACGSGQFLTTFASKISNPENIYGFDIDTIAVRIARINLMIKYPNINFTPNIYVFDTLFDQKKEYFDKFDFIATNPPWGAHFNQQQKNKLLFNFPEIKSFESASYFICQSFKYLKQNGKMSFVLPISIINVKIHEDIRIKLLELSRLLQIVNYNKLFKNVFTDVIRLDIQKNNSNSENIILVKDANNAFKINQKEYSLSHYHNFFINTSAEELQLLKKIYSFPHTTLKNNAKFGLGIVTGNNSKYLKSNQEIETEPILTGKEIKKFKPSKNKYFLKFESNKMQQVSALELYKAKEKLVYKFISKKLVFAYDDKQMLTLNSANILIPKINGYNIKIILALFNSSLYNFIFRKKFNSVKVLRSHIEELPIQLIDDKAKEEIINLANLLINSKIEINLLDKYVYKLFKITKSEQKCIEKL